jgi:hypothetical protein
MMQADQVPLLIENREAGPRPRWAR